MIKEAFHKLVHHWKILLTDRAYLISLIIGIGLIVFAYFLNFWASAYNDSKTYLSVGDLILDQLPVVNLNFLFLWGIWGLILLMFVYPVFFKPEIIPFGLKTFSILIYLRCGFILLTNVGPPEGFYFNGGLVGGNFLADFMFKNDLFFSGHTAYPFLAFLVFRDHWIRWIFLVSSFVMAATVLLMHVHYSIDVFAAFFITFATYEISDRIFNRLNLRFSNRLKLLGWDAIQKIKNKILNK